MLALRIENALIILFIMMGVAASVWYPAYGSVFFWGSMLVLYFFTALYNKLPEQLTILSCALVTSTVFQASIPVGYRMWHYVALLTLLLLFFSKRIKITGIAWYIRIYLLLVVYMTFRAAFAGSVTGEYIHQVRNLTMSMSCFALGKSAIRALGQEQRLLYIEQFFFVTTCCIGVAVFGGLLTVNASERLGIEQGMDPNGLGFMAAAAVLSILAGMHLRPIQLIKSDLFRISVYIIVVTAALVSVLLSGSRSTLFILICVGLVPLLLRNLTIRIKFLYVAIALVSFWVVVLIAPPEKTENFEARLLRSFTEKKIDRLEHLYLAYRMVEKAPAFGNGPGSFQANYTEYKHHIRSGQRYTDLKPHNLLAMYLSDYGFMGLAIFVALLCLYPRIVRESHGPLRIVAAMAFVMLLGRCMSGVLMEPFAMACLGLVAGAGGKEGEKMEDGRWKIEDGRWKLEDGR